MLTAAAGAGAGRHGAAVASAIQTVTLVAAAVTLWRARRGAVGRLRLGLTLQVASIGIGTLSALARSAVIQLRPSAVVVDITVAVTLLYVPTQIAGLVAMRGERLGRRRALRLALDGVTAGTAMLVAAWPVVLDSVFSRGGSGHEIALMLAHPVCQLAIVAVGVSVLADARPEARSMLRWIVVAELFSNVGLGGMVLQSRQGVGAFGWPQVVVEAGLVALVVAGRQPLQRDAGAAPTNDIELFLPYLPVVVATTTNLVAMARDAHVFGLAEAAVCAVMLGSLLGRQALHATELKWQAHTDALTGLANRPAFLAALHRATDRSAPATVLLIDVDEFKEINDSFGHAAGDEVLTGLAARVMAVAGRHEALPARLGGDEFAILVTGRDVAAAAASVIDELTRWHRLPTLAAGALNVSLSVGVGMLQAGDGPSQVLRRADLAMYHAKRRSGPAVAHYDPAFAVAADRRVILARDIEGAAERGETRLVYQPIYNLTSGELNGVEALLRWRHPVLGDVAPVEFVPLAEETGSIVDLGEWVIRAAVTDLLAWQRAGTYVPELYVNVSADQLRVGLVETLERVLPAELDRTRLVLEVTESRFSDGAVRAECDAIRGIGVRIAIDDFGSGWSTLAELASLRVDVVKLERAFTQHVDTPRGRHVIASIMTLAAGLGLTTVAEGIETAEQAEVMRGHGCPLGQGYHLCVPVEADDVPGTVSRRILAQLPAQLSGVGSPVATR